MTVAIYPGSFDPITYGHIDIINRASEFVDKLYIGVMKNCKKNYLFSLEERKELIEYELFDNPKVEVIAYEGLLVNYMKEKNIRVIIKGLRNLRDYDYEVQMARTNKNLYNDTETFFILSSEKYSFLSSSIVKEIYANDGNIYNYVPMHVIDAMDKKKSKNSKANIHGNKLVQSKQVNVALQQNWH
ncbi:pantetheine-phosphate adenylyltransferase [Cytobacillus sp. Hz8]|uniref:pantetheine-phosphate adenylyltransferase n=1 Tax=Cytobacillus sp. Hz8 TaxID=3347168 RepID=UPI0035D56187